MFDKRLSEFGKTQKETSYGVNSANVECLNVDIRHQSISYCDSFSSYVLILFIVLIIKAFIVGPSYSSPSSSSSSLVFWKYERIEYQSLSMIYIILSLIRLKKMSFLIEVKEEIGLVGVCVCVFCECSEMMFVNRGQISINEKQLFCARMRILFFLLLSINR